MTSVALAGGNGASTLLSVLRAEHAHGRGLLTFFSTKEACVLRRVCNEFRSEVSAFPWYDAKTYLIRDDLRYWRKCFPRAIAVNVSYCDKSPGDVESLRGIQYIEMIPAGFMRTPFTDADIEILRESYPELVVNRNMFYLDPATWGYTD